MTGFTINADFVKVLDRLKDAERGRLWTAMCKYALTGEDAVLSGNESYLWPATKLMVDGSLVVSEKPVKNHTYIRERENIETSCIGSTNKTTKKRTSTEYSVEFEHFWTEYPKDRRIDKQIAYQEWQKISPDEELVGKIIDSVKAWKRCEQWEDPKYIPHPAKWLKNKRWESTPPGRKKHFSYERDGISKDDFNALCVNLNDLDEQQTVNMDEMRFS